MIHSIVLMQVSLLLIHVISVMSHHRFMLIHISHCAARPHSFKTHLCHRSHNRLLVSLRTAATD